MFGPSAALLFLSVSAVTPPPVPHDRVPIPERPTPTHPACGPWQPGNGVVDEALASGLTATRLAFTELGGTDKLTARSPWWKARDNAPQLERLAADIALYTVGLWATQGKGPLYLYPLMHYRQCLNGDYDHCKHFNDDSLALIVAPVNPKTKRREYNLRAMPRRPPEHLIETARRELGCGPTPATVAQAPATSWSQRDMINRAKAARRQLRDSWEAYWRVAYADEIARAEAAAREAEIAAREAAERQRAEAQQARQARIDKAQETLRNFPHRDLVELMVKVMAHEPMRRSHDARDYYELEGPFETAWGETVQLSPRAIEVLPAVHGILTAPLPANNVRFHPSHSVYSWGKHPGWATLVLGYLERGIAKPPAKPIRSLARRLLAPPPYAALVATIHASNEAKQKAVNERLAKQAAEYAAAPLAQPDQPFDWQAAYDSYRASRPPLYEGMPAGVRAQHDQWTRQRIDKGVREGWLTER